MTRDTLDMFQQPDRGRFGDNETQPRPGNGPKVTGSSRLVDLDMVRHNDVIMPASILCSLDGSRTKAVVLPNSQIEVVATGPVERKARSCFDQNVRVTLPRWLAEKKGLV